MRSIPVKNKVPSIIFGGLAALAALQRIWIFFIRQPEPVIVPLFYFTNVFLSVLYLSCSIVIFKAKTTLVRDLGILVSLILIIGGAVLFIWTGWLPLLDESKLIDW